MEKVTGHLLYRGLFTYHSFLAAGDELRVSQKKPGLSKPVISPLHRKKAFCRQRTSMDFVTTIRNRSSPPVVQRRRMVGEVPYDHVVKLPQVHGRHLTGIIPWESLLDMVIDRRHGLLAKFHGLNDVRKNISC